VLSREISVSAPDGAVISLDGVVVGKGAWRSERVRPGPHTVSAAVQSLADCSTAQQEQRVRVASEGVTDVKLTPEPCGILLIDAQPGDARYVIRSPAGTDVTAGAVQPDRPLVLPVGTYTLRVTSTYCADYVVDVTIAAEQTHRERVRLICG
jgi:hypothetical protein